jgi:hypothetical protein
MSCNNTPNGTEYPHEHEHPEPVYPAGEVTGLQSAKEYAASMAAGFAAAAPQVEEFTDSLTGFGVSGEAIAAGMLAGEAQANAADAWHLTHAALARQDQITEAYAAVPGAGTREFLTSE